LTTGSGYTGQQEPGDGGNDYNAQSFLVNQILSRVNTATLVRVLSCTNDGGLSPVGLVDVQPLVNQVDGAGNGKPSGALHNLPYCRIQGGADAIIIDPKPGDIGIAVFASRDISKVKNTKAQANPGSWARFSMSDGLYIGGVLNGTPVQYVQFTGSGINVVSPSKITCTAPSIEMDASEKFAVNSANIVLNGPVQQGAGSNSGNVSMGGTLNVTGTVTGAGIGLSTHVHSDPQGGTTGAPV